MIARCHTPTATNYYKYGAKGITVCSLWRRSFKEFKEWAVANGYDESLSIDRINTLKGYYPDNCRFVGMTTQALNKPAPSNNTSGIKNIYWHSYSQRWKVVISIKGKKKYLGSFLDIWKGKQVLDSYLQEHNLTEHIRGHTYG